MSGFRGRFSVRTHTLATNVSLYQHLNKTGRLLFWFWWGAVSLGTGGLAVIGFMQAGEAFRSGAWSSVEGKVVRTEVKRNVSRNSDGRSRVSYSPVLEYHFQVGDRIFHGHRMQILGHGYNSRRAASHAIKELITDNRCLVYYNPTDPEQCSLKVGLEARHLFAPAAGFAFFLIAQVIGWRIYRQSTASRRSGDPDGTSVEQPVSSNEELPPPHDPAELGPRGEFLQQNVTRLGREHIGSDSPVHWYIHSVLDEGPLSYVVVEPFPKDAGYDKWVFVVWFDPQPAELVATYCFENEDFHRFSSLASYPHSLPYRLPRGKDYAN